MPKQLRRYQPVTIRDKTKVFRFGSGLSATRRKLSNFHRSPLVLRESDFESKILTRFPVLFRRLREKGDEGVRFLSSEAAWQAVKARNGHTFRRFEAEGDLGKDPTPKDFLKQLTGKKKTLAEAEKKYTYWIEKRQCVGILPKLAANPAKKKHFGLTAGDFDYEREYLTEDIEESVWGSILRSKAASDADFDSLLKQHRGWQFVEFGRRCRSDHFEKTRSENHWAGFDDGEKIFGGNRMGQLMEKLSEKLSQ